MVNATVGGEQEHYGAFFAQTEYESKALTFSANILFLATQKLNLTLGGSFINSKGSMDVTDMTEVPDEVYDNVASADYDYTPIIDYSDLAYTQYNLSFGGEYKITERISFTADVIYYDLTDDEGYVYGIETGSLYIIRTGVRIGF